MLCASAPDCIIQADEKTGRSRRRKLWRCRNVIQKSEVHFLIFFLAGCDGSTSECGPPLEKKQIFSTYIATSNVLYYRISVVWVLIRKPYKTPNKKENWPKSFLRDYLWTFGKGVLYWHWERSGVLYGNHIYIVMQEEGGDHILKIKTLLVGVLLCTCSCGPALTNRPSVHHDTRTILISRCIASFHQELVKLSKEYPQLSGIDRALIKDGGLHFESGVTFPEKKGIPHYTHQNACQIRLSIRDVADIRKFEKGKEHLYFAASEIYCGPEIGISYAWTFWTNPKGKNSSEFRIAVKQTFEESFLALINELKKEWACITTGWTWLVFRCALYQQVILDVRLL